MNLKNKIASCAEGKNRWRHTGGDMEERCAFMSWDVRHCCGRFVVLKPQLKHKSIFLSLRPPGVHQVFHVFINGCDSDGFIDAIGYPV